MSNVQDFPYYDGDESTHLLICVLCGFRFINAPLLTLKMIIFNLTTLTTFGFILSIGTVFIKITHLVRFNTRMSRRFRKLCQGVIRCTKKPHSFIHWLLFLCYVEYIDNFDKENTTYQMICGIRETTQCCRQQCLHIQSPWLLPLLQSGTTE